MKSYSAWNAERAGALIDELVSLPGALLPVLHRLQDEFGYIDEAAVPLLAEALNLSRAEVHGTISFYHDFRHQPPGRHILKMCRAEACQSMGAEALVAHLERSLGLRCGETSADGQITVEAVYCLGLCAVAPGAMLDGAVVGRLNERRLDTLMAEAKR